MSQSERITLDKDRTNLVVVKSGEDVYIEGGSVWVHSNNQAVLVLFGGEAASATIYRTDRLVWRQVASCHIETEAKGVKG